MDLIIPSNVVKEYKIEAGDVFEITVETVRNEVIIKYRRIFINLVSGCQCI